jgi:large subunit ribosomal protein L1
VITMKIEEAINQLKGSKRNFVQTYDLIINLKNIDMKKPENNFSKEVQLPHGTGKEISVCVISENIKEGENYDVLRKSDIENIDKKEAKKIARKYDFFLCEAPLMVLVGKNLGRYLGPKGKMPKPIPPNAGPSLINPLVEIAKKSVRIVAKGSPTIHTFVGKEVIEEVEKTLPKGRSQIKSVLLKLTMSKPVKIDV